MQLLVPSNFFSAAPGTRVHEYEVNGGVGRGWHTEMSHGIFSELSSLECSSRSCSSVISGGFFSGSRDFFRGTGSDVVAPRNGRPRLLQSATLVRTNPSQGCISPDCGDGSVYAVMQLAGLKSNRVAFDVKRQSILVAPSCVNAGLTSRIGFSAVDLTTAQGDFVSWERPRKNLQKVCTQDGGVASEVFISTPAPATPPAHSRVTRGTNVFSPSGAAVSYPSHSSVLPVQNLGLVGIPASNVLVECLEVTGGTTLSGHLKVSGAKNSALAVLAGALCCREPLSLRMIPDLHDIRRMFQVLQSTGARVRRVGSSIIVDASQLTNVEPCPEAVRKLRASFFVIGALVGRQGEAVVPLPGGCNIGARPIDLHVRGLESLGADVEIRYGSRLAESSTGSELPFIAPKECLGACQSSVWSISAGPRQGKVHARASSGRRLVGGSFHLDYPSVGATETLMMAAALADGSTVLSNVAQEPEVVDLANFLISCGAIIHGAGTNTLHIKGVKQLHTTDFTIIPDRIEAGTFLIAAAITRSSVSMSPVVPQHLTAVIGKLRTIGCRIQQMTSDSLRISATTELKSSDVTTLPYPGFPTDLQPQLMSLMTTCDGQSVVEETVFESRMRHVEELQKLGAKVRVSRNVAYISGKDQGSSLYGAPVTATDLRAGAALVLAGMAAEGTTHIEGVNHIDRGYEQLDEKLRLLGADVKRLPCLPSEIERLPSLPLESSLEL